MDVDNCQRCNRCCTSFGVCLTIFDIFRIAKSTGEEPEKFVALIDDYQPRQRTEPAVTINGQMKLLVLKHGKQRVCKFFKNGGCSIYHSRPYLCRTYPFTIKNGELADVENRACAVLWHPQGKNRDDYIKNLQTYFRQIEQYRKIVDEWNRNFCGSLADFISFAENKLKNSEVSL